MAPRPLQGTGGEVWSPMSVKQSFHSFHLEAPHKSGGADIAAWRLPSALKKRLKGSRLSEGSSLKGSGGPAPAQAFNDLREKGKHFS